VATGTVTELHRWPVKSMAGEPVDAARLDGRGLAGDRAHALFDVHKGQPRRLTVRQVPRLLRWSAAYESAPGDALDPDDVPAPVLTAPDGRRLGWEDPALASVLSADLGREVTLRRDVALMPDLPDSLLVTTQATLDAVGQALGPLDLRRFRTNLHVVLDAPPYAEERWEGRELQVGDVRFTVLHPCARCVIPTRDPDTTAKEPALLRWLTREHGGLFGVNVRALAPGRVAVGDAVQLL
jgi:uncharacterized protein YcbX